MQHARPTTHTSLRLRPTLNVSSCFQTISGKLVGYSIYLWISGLMHAESFLLLLMRNTKTPGSRHVYPRQQISPSTRPKETAEWMGRYIHPTGLSKSQHHFGRNNIKLLAQPNYEPEKQLANTAHRTDAHELGLRRGVWWPIHF
jgi:hypothetical protein